MTAACSAGATRIERQSVHPHDVSGGIGVPVETLLRRGETVPHFSVQTVTGDMFHYSSIWQRKNLVLITVDRTDSAHHYVRTLRGHDAEFDALEGVCVVTIDRVAGLPAPAVLVADRWGEIVHVSGASDAGGLPAVQELLDWLGYLQNRCPECEGEAR